MQATQGFRSDYDRRRRHKPDLFACFRACGHDQAGVGIALGPGRHRRSPGLVRSRLRRWLRHCDPHSLWRQHPGMELGEAAFRVGLLLWRRRSTAGRTTGQPHHILRVRMEEPPTREKDYPDWPEGDYRLSGCCSRLQQQLRTAYSKKCDYPQGGQLGKEERLTGGDISGLP